MTASIDDYKSIESDGGRTLILRRSIERIAELDTLIFDVDGVLLDISDSIQHVHALAAERYFGRLGWTNCVGLVSPEDVDSFKLAGGFNDDWDTAAAWTLLYLFKSSRFHCADGAMLAAHEPTTSQFTAELARIGGGLPTAFDLIRETCDPSEWADVESDFDRPLLERIFKESYSGDLCPEVYGFEPEFVTGPGMIRRDKPILERGLLPRSVRLGIATGRTSGEAAAALRIHGWQDLFSSETIVTEDDGFKKPDPRILELAVARSGARVAIYVGDTPDDLRTVKRYSETHVGMISCMVLTGFPDSRVQEARRYFLDEEADIVADNVNTALSAIKLCIGGGALCLAEERR